MASTVTSRLLLGNYPRPMTLPSRWLSGGVDLAVSKHIWIRAAHVDYHYSELRNLNGDRQNQFRITGGIVFRGAGK